MSLIKPLVEEYRDVFTLEGKWFYMDYSTPIPHSIPFTCSDFAGLVCVGGIPVIVKDKNFYVLRLCSRRMNFVMETITA